jgi:PqqD family protein of HPr-rel-A system
VTSSSGRQRWSLACRPDSLVLRDFDDGAVLFDHRDGQTHYVNPIVSTLLKHLLGANPDTEQLIAHLENRFEATFNDEERAEVLRMLNQLQALNLIRCKQESET